MTAWYNENDPFAAQWLRNLIGEGLIPDGEVDQRSIADVRPSDLDGFSQCHFFAGIGGWPRALHLAQWPEDRPVWTGSCPCQALSSAARGRNNAADLWPAWFFLIAANRPRTIFGEQVTAKDAWFDRVCDDLGSLDYEVGAAILPAVSVGADHARARIYFVGYAHGESQSKLRVDDQVARVFWDRGDAGNLVSSDGVSSQMAVLRAYGNAIVPQVAAEFIGAYLDG